jgi:hypothetical protein
MQKTLEAGHQVLGFVGRERDFAAIQVRHQYPVAGSAIVLSPGAVLISEIDQFPARARFLMLVHAREHNDLFSFD